MKSVTRFPAGALALALLAGPAATATLTVDPVNGPYFTIQSAVDAAASGDTILIKPNPNPQGYVENIVINTANLTLVGDTVAATANVNTQTCPSVALSGCGTPASPTVCNQNVLAVNAANVTLRKVAIRNGIVDFNPGVSGGGVSESCVLGNSRIGDTNDFVENLVIDRNVFQGGSSRSIDLRGSGHRVTNNRLFNLDDGIRLQGSSFVVSGNVIRGTNDEEAVRIVGISGFSGNTVIENNVISGAIKGINISGVAGSGTSIRRNQISGIYNPGIEVGFGQVVVISDNQIENTGDDGISISGSNCTISGNRIEAGGYDDDEGISVSGSNNTVENNTISLASNDAISVQGSGGHIVRNNTILRSNNESGSDACIDVSSGNNQIIGNTMRYCGLTGIRTGSGDANVFQGNTVTGTGQIAIRLDGGSNAQVTGNAIAGGAGLGITVGNATNVQITNNTVTGNAVDICTGYAGGTGNVSVFTGNTYTTGGDTYTCPWFY